MAQEEKAKMIVDVLKEHPYIKAMKKAFAPPIYRPVKYFTYMFDIKTKPFFVNEEDEAGWYGKRFNRKNWLVKKLFKIRKCAQIMSRKEIEWLGSSFRNAQEGTFI